ncbi:hypothetical protein Acsp02_90180 [Actinoplanes sp. NBRC 103695]|nr:hypothetical protein Acsp02_90180 [Actinoplanes sp. NBRC 103695]
MQSAGSPRRPISTGVHSTIEYDSADRLSVRTNATGEATRYIYDILGRVVERRTAGIVTLFEYDARGHVVSVVSPDAEVRFERDGRAG